MKRLLIGSNGIHSHLAQVYVEAWLAVVEKVRKMIMKEVGSPEEYIVSFKSKQNEWEYTPQLGIEQDPSPKAGRRRMRSRRPTSAPNTTDTDWRAELGATDPSKWQAWNHWQQGSTDWRVGMRRLECTWSGLDTEKTTNAGCAEAECYRLGSISSTTAAGGESSRQLSGRRWERPLDGKRADAGMCKSLSVSQWKNATKWWWTSWQRLTSGSSRPLWRRSTGRRSTGRAKGVWTRCSLFSISSISLVFVCFLVFLSLLIVCTWLIFHCHRGRWVAGGGSAILPACPEAEGGVTLCHTLIRVNTVWIKQIKQTNRMSESQLARSTQDEALCMDLQAAWDSNGPAICSKLVQRFLFVYSDILRRTTAEIISLIDTERTYFNAKDVWWCLSQDIPGIWHETHANDQVVLYG